MRKVLITILTLSLLFSIISCRYTKEAAPDSQRLLQREFKSTYNSRARAVTDNKSNQVYFWGIPIDRDLFSTFIYSLILILSCLYCKQTGRQRTTIEENLAVLSRGISWRQRIALFLLSWLHRNNSNSQTTRKNRKR